VNLTLRSTAPRRPFKGLAAFTSMLTLSGSLLLVAGAAAASAAAANPHNGTVKLDGKSVDTDDPANEPHLNSCSIPVEWFDFDNAAFTSVVSFVEKGGPGNNNPVPIATQVPPGSIAFTGASTNQLNHTVTFTLNTAGALQHRARCLPREDGRQRDPGQQRRNRLQQVQDLLGPAVPADRDDADPHAQPVGLR
jgi:hypothetical protein